jgi:hypothetical protein
MASKKASHKPTVFKKWGFTMQEVSDLVEANPSMKGLIAGYLAEVQLRRMFFSDARTEYLGKHDDHDRINKGDLRILYKGREFNYESKSLNGKNFKFYDGKWHGRANVDGSDSIIKELPSGKKVKTVLLPYGTFDIVAVNLFAFEDAWHFIFARNKDLPSCKHKDLTDEERKYFLMSMIPVTWPPTPPWTDDPYPLMDEILAEPPTPPDLVVDETAAGETIIEVRASAVKKRKNQLLPFQN